MKILGYRSYHKKKTIPVTSFDFLSYYITVFRGSECLGGYQSLFKSICLQHGCTFSPEDQLFHDKNDYPHHQKSISDWVGPKVDCAYNFHYTFNPHIQARDEFIDVRRLVDTSVHLFYRSMNMKNVLTVATIDFGVDKKLHDLGFNRLPGTSNFQYHAFQNAECAIMVREGHRARERYSRIDEKILKLWDERVIFSEGIKALKAS